MKFVIYCIVFSITLYFSVLTSSSYARQNRQANNSTKEVKIKRGTSEQELAKLEKNDQGRPDDKRPISNLKSDQGDLFGDLYVILRYQGGESKRIPRVDDNGNPVYISVDWTDPSGNTIEVQQQDWDIVPAVGGEPVLTENFVPYTMTDEDTGEYIPNPLTDDIWYAAPTPSQCVQPVASYDRWGNISSETGLGLNRIPLNMVYDSTWDRTECEVGLQTIFPDGNIEVNLWFVEPGGIWSDPVNDLVTYVDGVLWTDLVQEVHFGRMNVGRSPDAVMQASFDEAIRSINGALAIEIDAAGRILLTKEVYSELEVNPYTGEPILLETTKKAIDSPLENMALYVKLLEDGHLVTPGDERAPIDRSELGGIPLSQMLTLTDGPSDAIRPTIDIVKMRQWGLGHLVDVSEVEYYTYFDVTYNNLTSCNPVSRELIATHTSCDALSTIDECGQPIICDGPFSGILTDDNSQAAWNDFRQAASLFAASADKTGDVTVDMTVYLNSIFGLNKVIGYSAYDSEGNPLPDAVNYAQNPVYYDFQDINGYNRGNTYQNRGEVLIPGGNNMPSTYSGAVRVLQPLNGGWTEQETIILGDPDAVNNVHWNAVIVGWDPVNQKPVHTVGTDNIMGFTQMADDDLNVIEFIHTYQIPENR